MATKTDGFTIGHAMQHGWKNGEAMAAALLRPWVRHLDDCWAGEDDEPQTRRCTCELRRVWQGVTGRRTG